LSFSGNCDACADEEPKDNTKGKVMTLEKVMVVKMESEKRVAAVERHYSVNEPTSYFIGKNDKIKGIVKSSTHSSNKIFA
jgi:hypothetical protein